MFFGSIPALVTPFSGGRVAEDTFREANCRGFERPGAVRNDRGSCDAHPRRASRGGRDRGAGRKRQGAGDRRLRQLLDSGIDRDDPRRRPRRGERRAGRRALLQQAEPGWARRAFHRGGGSLAVADYRLQRAVADRRGYFGGDARRGLQAFENHRREGCDRQSRQGDRPAARLRNRLLPAQRMGGVGCISVTANVAPKLCAEFQKAMREGRWDDALSLQDKLYPLHAALFTDASPAPAKYALSRLRPGFPTELRLPLVEASEASKRAVNAALEHAGLA